MSERQQLTQLVELAGVASKVALMDLANAIQNEKRLRASLDQLVAALHDRAAFSIETTDTALMGGADVNWQVWVEKQRGAINQELARCLVEQERLRLIASQMQGREQVAIAIRNRKVIEACLASRRKADYTS